MPLPRKYGNRKAAVFTWPHGCGGLSFDLRIASARSVDRSAQPSLTEGARSLAASENYNLVFFVTLPNRIDLHSEVFFVSFASVINIVFDSFG